MAWFANQPASNQLLQSRPASQLDLKQLVTPWPVLKLACRIYNYSSSTLVNFEHAYCTSLHSTQIRKSKFESHHTKSGINTINVSHHSLQHVQQEEIHESPRTYTPWRIEQKQWKFWVICGSLKSSFNILIRSMSLEFLEADVCRSSPWWGCCACCWGQTWTLLACWLSAWPPMRGRSKTG